MPRIARIVVPEEPHHMIQRGNRRLPTFFCEDDYCRYLDLLRERCEEHAVEVWAYCLMTNHVHLILVPATESGLRLALGQTHKRYTTHINKREGWTGHLWQARFSSYAMDEAHLLAAARYIELNPVRAGIVGDPSEYKWSSAKVHLAAKDDLVVKVAPLLSRIPNWKSFLSDSISPEDQEAIQKHSRTGRPLGDKAFFDRLQCVLGKDVRPKKPGPKKRDRWLSP